MPPQKKFEPSQSSLIKAGFLAEHNSNKAMARIHAARVAGEIEPHSRYGSLQDADGSLFDNNDLMYSTLDYAVAKAAGLRDHEIAIHHGVVVLRAGSRFHPSGDWCDGGPIVEANRISVVNKNEGAWLAAMDVNFDGQCNWNLSKAGHTPLTAAMRCFVFMYLGDEIWIPKGLL